MDYQVIIIQIPVASKGDCTLHLLVGQDPQQAKKLKVENAVLMDGGMSKTATNIGFALEDAANKYGGPFKLDAIVVTHWDRDHFLGTQDFFKDPNNRRNYLKATQTPLSSGSTIYEVQTKLYCPTAGGDSAKNFYNIINEPLKQGDTVKPSDREILGIDFFTGERLLTLDEERAFERIRNRQWKHDKPAFLCLAGNGWVYTRNGPMPCPVPDINAQSIIAITCNIHDPTKMYGYGVPYYCAGDGNRECEDTLAVYLAEQGLKVDTMKATHHGSFDSFSHALFEAFQPRNYVVSAGLEHGHPSVALLLELFKYRVRAKLQVFTSILPYWFATPEKFQALNVTDLAATVGALEKWVGYQEGSHKINTIDQAYFKSLQAALTKLGQKTKEAEDKVEEVEEEMKEAKRKKDANAENDAKKRKTEVETKEKEEVADALHSAFELLSKTDVDEDLKEAEKSLKENKIPQSTPHQVTITIRPNQPNMINRVEVKV